MKFGTALLFLEQGQKVKRKDWGGYWFISSAEPYLEAEKVHMNPMIVACLKDNGGYAPATPYQADLLATDWEVVKND